jgi:hypothetical protein
MTPTLPTRRALLACGVLTLTGLLAIADDKKPAAPTGTWTMKDGETQIEFADKGVLKILPHGDKFDFALVCEITVGKDGAVKAKITDLEGKEEIKAKVKDRLPVGSAFTFKWTATGDAGTLADVEGKEIEAFKSKLEGSYEKKK